ncbi:hypothetical protein EDB87DRAFT_1011153 [Lactarius vividus]|nr:hypothetical protein EDB87DRAFT_1011153 [Lactarius vividus]
MQGIRTERRGWGQTQQHDMMSNREQMKVKVSTGSTGRHSGIAVENVCTSFTVGTGASNESLEGDYAFTVKKERVIGNQVLVEHNDMSKRLGEIYMGCNQLTLEKFSIPVAVESRTYTHSGSFHEVILSSCNVGCTATTASGRPARQVGVIFGSLELEPRLGQTSMCFCVFWPLTTIDCTSSFSFCGFSRLHQVVSRITLECTLAVTLSTPPLSSSI